jgi:peptide/nickel transport system permease protein
MLFIFALAIPIGVQSAIARGSLFDKAMTVLVFLGFALPGFWLALLLQAKVGVQLGWLPVLGLKSVDYEALNVLGKFLDVSRHLVLPIIVAVIGSLAGISRYMRQGMLNVLNEDYIRTAYAFGLPKHKIIYNYALRNTLLPIITILGLSIPGLISSSVIFEYIFSIPGMGQLMYEAVMSRDYNVIMAELVMAAVLTLIGNFLADITYAYADPRIRITGKDERAIQE